MKLRFVLLLIVVPLAAFAQTSTKEVYSALEGSWVKMGVNWVDENRKDALPDYHQHYLKYEFTNKKKLLAFGSYVANGVVVDHQLNGRKLDFSFGRHFLIESIDEDHMVMVEVEGGDTGAKTIRFEFVREQLYIESLPVRPEDYMVRAKGDTVFFDSEKFHPKFQPRKYPDFHLYLHNQIKRFYPMGENYFFASFEIDRDGVIDHIQVFSHANQRSTEKAIQAIKESEGKWQLPKLKNKGATVLMTIEDRFHKRKPEGGYSLEANQNDISQRYNDAYVNAHQKAVGQYLRGQHSQMTEWLDWCEKMRPDEPSLAYLKYLYYQALLDKPAAQQQKEILSATPLNFLMN